MNQDNIPYINNKLEILVPTLKSDLLIDKYTLMWNIYKSNPIDKKSLDKSIVNSRIYYNKQHLGCNYID